MIGDWNLMIMKDFVINGYCGFDIDVIIELVKDLGVKVEYVVIDWKILVNGIIVNKYDIIGSVLFNMLCVKVVGYS